MHRHTTVSRVAKGALALWCVLAAVAAVLMLAATPAGGQTIDDPTLGIINPPTATDLLDGPLNLTDISVTGGLLGDVLAGHASSDLLAITDSYNAGQLAIDAAELARKAKEAELAKRAGTGGAKVGGEIPYADVFNSAAASVGIDPRMLAAQAYVESVAFDPDVISCGYDSPEGARGIMQFMPSTAAGYGIDPCDPPQAIPAAAKMDKGLFDQFGSWDLVFAGYNAGPGAVEQYGGVPPYAETRDYIERINEKWAEYRQRWPEGTITASSEEGICDASGIQISCDIAGNVNALLSAAAADGVTLTGSGWRDSAEQIQLRKQHCGTSDYAIYQMPSGECSPPTAIPGTSMHERGLAIDFENCNTRSTACYQWLAGNASNYGLYNLPSEPWHWSTSGN